MEFFLCDKRKIAAKPTAQIKFSCLKSIVGNVLNSLIININFESWKLLYSLQQEYWRACRYRLIGQNRKCAQYIIACYLLQNSFLLVRVHSLLITHCKIICCSLLKIDTFLTVNSLITRYLLQVSLITKNFSLLLF